MIARDGVSGGAKCAAATAADCGFVAQMQIALAIFSIPSTSSMRGAVCGPPLPSASLELVLQPHRCRMDSLFLLAAKVRCMYLLIKIVAGDVVWAGHDVLLTLLLLLLLLLIHGPGSIFFNTVDIFNASSGVWTIAALSVARAGLAATSLPNGLAIFAGGGA